MKLVSQQGLNLSASQRRHLDLQARMRAISKSPFHAEVQAALVELDERKEQGVKPEKQYFHVSTSHGTHSFAEWMGF
jgi:hypothetical protein